MHVTRINEATACIPIAAAWRSRFRWEYMLLHLLGTLIFMAENVDKSNSIGTVTVETSGKLL